MTSWRSRIAITAVWVAALATCKKEEALPESFAQKGPAVDVSKLQAPPLFAHIPADTPYVMASFEAWSVEYFAKTKRVLAPVLSRGIDQMRGLLEDSEVLRWFDAVTEVMDGKWTEQGLESLGLSARPRFALYGHGAAPVVLRLEVKDSKKLLATLERVAQKAGAQLPPLEQRHGGEFWRIELPGELGAVISLAANQLVAAVGPRHAVAAVMPLLVGTEKPARNMADGKQLKDLIAKHKLGPQLIGYVDSKRLAHELIALADRAPSQECTTAIDRLAGQVPRFVMSYTEASAKRYTGAMILELGSGAAGRLKELRTPVPGLSAALEGEPMLALGGGIDLERGKAAGKAVAGVMRDLGEACESRDLTRVGRDLREAMSEALPGPIAKLAGVALAIDSIDFGSQRARGGTPPIPREVDGFAMIGSRDAKGMFEALSDELPPVAAVGIEPDGKLHTVELTKFGLPFDVRAGVGKEVIAVSSGSRGKKRAEKALGATAGSSVPLLAGTFDMGKLSELQAQLASSSQLEREYNEALAQLFGRTTFTMDATDAGLEIWFSAEIK